MTLLPCPFCGGEAEVRQHCHFDYYSPQCKNWHCVAYGTDAVHDTPEEAAAAWNTRAKTDTEEA